MCVETKKRAFLLFKLKTTHRQVKIVMLLVYRNLGEGEGCGYVALNILNVNIDKYEQRQCNQLAGTIPIQCGSVGRIFPFTSLHTTGSLCVPGLPPPL